MILENFEYDNLGRLVKKTDANGTIVTNIYDDLDRIIQKDILPGNGVLGVTKETFEYDGLSRLTKSNDSNNRQLTFEYDLFSRLALESQNDEIIKYNYDNNNNLISLENNLNITNYSYDELSRVKDIKFNNEIISNYTYNGLENSKIIFGNNNQTTKTYDNLLRLETLTNFIKNHNFTYDKVGNITSNGEKNYIYDELYNLNQVTKSGSGEILENYTYDLPGNRLKDDNNIYEINNLNQITNISNSGSENKNYLYDNNGNLIQDNDKKYFYDYKNRLVKVENLATKEVIGEYFYDTLSRRYKKVTKTDTTNYIYSNENILSEKYLDNTQKYYINGIGTDNLVGFVLGKPDFSELETSEYEFCTTKVLVYKDDFIKFGHQNIIDRCLVLQEKSKNLIFKKYYFEKDNLGSIIGISNENGEIISSYEYDSFGNILNNSNLNFKNSRLFTSREFDEEIGFYYYRARYYDSKTGKFISRDPIDIADDVNLYVYVGNNPVNFVDPSGMDSKSIIDNDKNTIGDYILGGLYITGEFLLDNTLGIETAVSYEEGQEIEEYSFASEIGLSDKELKKAGYVGVAAGAAYGGYKLYKNIKTGKIVKIGKNTESFFDGTKLGENPLGKGKTDAFHQFSEIVENFEGDGIIKTMKGGDGNDYVHLIIEGSLRGRDGTFEFIKDSEGIITHRFFNPNR